MELPRKFLVSVFTVAAAASVVGVARYDNYKPRLSQQQTAVTQTVQQTVPVQQAPIQQAVKAPETTSEKQAKLAAMEASDQFMLLPTAIRPLRALTTVAATAARRPASSIPACIITAPRPASNTRRS